MPKKSFRPQHLELRHKTYFALLTVPKDVQPILGTKRFFQTTGTGDIKIAQAKADLFVIKWKAAIANARQQADDPIINSALELHRLMNSSPRHLVEDVIDEETYRLRDQEGDLIADTFSQVARGKSKLLESYICDWEQKQLEHGLQHKTVGQMKSDLAQLIAYIPTTNLVTVEACTAWINSLAKSKNYKSASVTRIISSCNNFYRYLQTIGIFSESTPTPFKVPNTYKQSKKRNANAINKRDSWQPFAKQELEILHHTAVQNDDLVLADLIAVAAYTGARIEELCSLKKDCIDQKNQTLKIVDAKTEAGNRIVPIHSKISGTIARLFNVSNNDYLFSQLTANKYGDRSNAIGKRFGRMKNTLGHGDRHVFHSIRKSFTTALEQAGVSENVAADIVGHEKQTMTYGLYSGGTSLDQKRKAIKKVDYVF